VLRMNREIIAQTAQGTVDGTMSFPDAVGKLLSAGVEYYHVDYIRMEKTFYGDEGETVVTPLPFKEFLPVVAEFRADGLRSAILESQRDGLKYREFSRRAIEAGVQGYFAFLRGKRVVYLGRTGDQHTEWFPGAGPSGKP